MAGNSFRRGRTILALWAMSALVARAGFAQATQQLTLTALLDRVRLEHPRVGASDSRVAVARGSRRAAGVYPNPVLGFNVENATLPGRQPSTGMDREEMATATLPLEFVYQRGVRVRRADAEVEAARADGLAERQQIALDAVHAYYRAALAQVEVAAARDLASWLDSLVVYNRNRAAQGVVGESDLLRAELERDRALADLALQEAMAAEARAMLGAFSGDSTATQSIAGPVWMPNAPLPLPEGVHFIHAELQAAQARVSAAGAGVGVARSFLIRDLSAMAGLKRSVGTTTLLAGFSLPLPLVDQNRGDIARARAEQSLAGFELASTERQVQAERSAAEQSAKLLLASVEALRGPIDTGSDERVRYLTRADEARRIALGAYREGAVPLFNVLDAARAWGEARTTYYRTLYAQHESAIALLAAHGRDLFTEIPPMLAAVKETPR